MRIILKPTGLIGIAAAFLLLLLIILRQNTMRSPVVAATTASPTSAEAVAAAPSTKPLLDFDIASGNWETRIATGLTATNDSVAATVPGHPRACRLTMPKAGANPWDVQIAHSLNAPLPMGRHYQLSYWARSKESCPVSVAIEQRKDPFAKLLYTTEALTPNWKQYTEEWDQAKDTPSDWAQIDFQTAARAGTVELTGVTIH